jgi:hypothetical protein
VRYVLKCKHRVGFALGVYDPKMPVVIDPVVSDSGWHHELNNVSNPRSQ